MLASRGCCEGVWSTRALGSLTEEKHSKISCKLWCWFQSAAEVSMLQPRCNCVLLDVWSLPHRALITDLDAAFCTGSPVRPRIACDELHMLKGPSCTQHIPCSLLSSVIEFMHV